MNICNVTENTNVNNKYAKRTVYYRLIINTEKHWHLVATQAHYSLSFLPLLTNTNNNVPLRLRFIKY